MNYRHHYHAGNYADVFKHALMLPILEGLQRKEKGLLYLDTHAGRGGYELEEVSVLPDGRERVAEWPAGIGRLWPETAISPSLASYLETVRSFNARKGGAAGKLQFYPGSPCIVRDRLRPQDRAVFCEVRPEDAEALEIEFGFQRRVSVQTLDGYTALRSILPPPEKRAFVLIDPPFEHPAEFADILKGLGDALRRFPSGTYAIWYPITERARSDEFKARLSELNPPPTLSVELQVASEASQVRMKGCGLVVINPPWQIDGTLREVLDALVPRLRVDDGAVGKITWLVPEK